MFSVFKYLFIFIAITIILVYLYIFFYLKFDKTKINEQIEILSTKLHDGPMQALLNGSGINNIPKLNILSTNTNVVNVNNCSRGPVYIGLDFAENEDCIKTCLNSKASVINVNENETYIYDTVQLKAGAHCILGPRPECNMRMTYAIMTINTIICRPRFPELIGGNEIGSNIVACNNSKFYHVENVLWDYEGNVRVNPWLTLITDVDEKLPDGSFRFRCKFNGVDQKGNKFQENFFNRFHPMRNYCASNLIAAHPDVRTVLDDNGKSFYCDCGNPEVTRVKHLLPDDKKSKCSHVQYQDELVKPEIPETKKSKRKLTIPYNCFNMYSLIEDVGKYHPCPPDLFTRNGPQMDSVSFEYSLNDKALIEHPIYYDFNDDASSGATVLNNVDIEKIVDL